MKNTERQETKYNAIVGTIGNDIYMLDDTFKYSDGFKGATGSVFRLVSQDELDERLNDDDYFVELWKDAVANDQTCSSFDDWYNHIDEQEKIAIHFDQSYSEYHDEIRKIMQVTNEEYPVIECTGDGRCFSKNMKFDKVFNQKLVKEINKFEEEEK